MTMIDDLFYLISNVGFLPLILNAIRGFFVEEYTLTHRWLSGDPETNPWVWRQILAAASSIAYGKFINLFERFTGREYSNYFESMVPQGLRHPDSYINALFA